MTVKTFVCLIVNVRGKKSRGQRSDELTLVLLIVGISVC